MITRLVCWYWKHEDSVWFISTLICVPMAQLITRISAHVSTAGLYPMYKFVIFRELSTVIRSLDFDNGPTATVVLNFFLCHIFSVS